ncbi:hypothetical protein [Paludisphaera mucosa]|uniref:PEP-CTERM protein-sorting domain-containing protein n=1 Tax=Paludisphaera mucosa TaxID=3030827 RepID=A0ABT6FIK9_9BACT|nr:hypothetical protein [Paludisphaera mucosa]MDG3007382.1 hypothetical protein [Paludisphaera mucosa]
MTTKLKSIAALLVGLCAAPSCMGGWIGYQTYDDFRLGSDAAVTSVNWQGFYYDSQNTGANPVGPDTSQWQVGFYGDGGGAPGGAISEQTLSAASVTTTLAGTLAFAGSTVNVYDFHADLTGPVDLSGGSTYWLSVLSIQDAFNPFFAWMSSNQGLNGLSFQRWYVEGIDVVQERDRAFSLGGAGGVLYDQPADYPTFPDGVYTAWTSTVTAAAVPEPAALVQATLAVAAAGGLALRRRRRPESRS